MQLLTVTWYASSEQISVWQFLDVASSIIRGWDWWFSLRDCCKENIYGPEEYLQISTFYVGQKFQNVSVTDGLAAKQIKKLNDSEKKSC